MDLPSENQIFELPAALPLECDELLLYPALAFATYGERRPESTILLLPGLTQSHRAADGRAASPEDPYTPDRWFEKYIGPGKPLDTDTYGFVCAGLLGSPFGSSSPITDNPEDADLPYGSRFPQISVTDIARPPAALCRALGIKRLAGVIGLGFGGMVALRLASLFPELVGSVAALGTTAMLPEHWRRKLGSVRQQLAADRSYRRGDYPLDDPPQAALARVRLGILRELFPRDQLAARFGDLFAAERALEAEAASFGRNFDANCYATLCEAHARVDLHESLGRIRSRTLILSASSDPLAAPDRARDTYHRLIAAGAPARYYELQSEAGHRAYEQESAKVGAVLREFLGR